ncbi:MAG: HlyD family efflux transporter periplasmic adaptor subunit [bacterium]|nr:HlyD family efflux transporter periplasmic adaptor subunit [bacterium]
MKIYRVVFLLILWGFCNACSNSPGYREVNAVKGPFHIKVHAIGRLRSSASTYVGCPPIRRLWNYTISSMAKEGKEVKEGDVILSFDTRELQERLALKSAELETAKKELERLRLVEQEKIDNFNLQLAEARVNKEKAVRKAQAPQEFTAMNEVKTNRMDLELAELSEALSRSRVENQTVSQKTIINTQAGKVKKLEMIVNEYRGSIDKMRVNAPKPGIVVYAVDWRGDKKAVGDRCWIGDYILELPDLSRMEVAAVIPEPEAGKVETGMPVEIRLDSNPDRVFKGEIKSLGRIFRTKSHDQPAMVFDAVVPILYPDPQLMRPGMAAGVDIIVSSKENVLQVPEAAVVYLESGLFVWKKGFMGKTMAPVVIGARSGGMVEVLDGLKENDTLIITAEGNGEE